MATRKSSKADQALRLVKKMGMVRPRDLAPFDIEPFHFRRLLQRGQLVQVSRGVYRSVEHETTAHHPLAEAAKRVPNGLICLLSALHYHGLCTQSPPVVWMAIDRKARLPSVGDKPIRFVRFSGAALQEGVEEHSVEGVPVRITSCAKTVADCFKYRNKLGLDVALEALRTCLRQRMCPADRLLMCARVCRVESVMRPYLQALSPNT